MKHFVSAVLLCLIATPLAAQTNPLWNEQKVRNYLPHMSTAEVAD